MKTKLTDQTLIQQALTRMELTFQVGDFKITQYGKTEKAEIKFDSAVGLSQQKDGTWAMVGDFYHSKNSKLRKFYNNTDLFSKELFTNYAVEEAIDRLQAQNFFCADNEEAVVDSNGIVTMTFQR